MKIIEKPFNLYYPMGGFFERLADVLKKILKQVVENGYPPGDRFLNKGGKGW